MQMNTFLIDGLKRLAASVQIASACFMNVRELSPLLELICPRLQKGGKIVDFILSAAWSASFTNSSIRTRKRSAKSLAFF